MLRTTAKAELSGTTEERLPPLLEWFEATNRDPDLVTPRWLAPIAEALSNALTEPTRIIISTPPQHGKSTLIFHWIAWAMAQTRRPLLYVTYSDTFAGFQMRKARRVAVETGLQFRPRSVSSTDWELANGGSLSAGGIGGSITGKPGGIIVLDDLIKNWEEAQSQTVREKVWDDLRASVLTRAHPNTSIVMVCTRWHPDDPAARLERLGWKVINLPAIDDDGVPLWPEGRPLDFLEKQREELGEHIFGALYMGRPRPIGGEVFGQPHWCSVLDIPTSGLEAFGLDLAYSAKTKADRSVSVFARRQGDATYIADVSVGQKRIEDFAQDLKRFRSISPGAPMRWYTGTAEVGAGAYLASLGIEVQCIQARYDKLVRSHRTAAAWNAGKILIPREAKWAPAFVSVVCGFTGSNDKRDDEVDALVAAFDLLQTATAQNEARREVPRRGMMKRGTAYL